MSSTLFIHNNPSILDRIQNEAAQASHPAPILAKNLVQGLRAISNPAIKISGIYFCPADSSYSALRFVELVLLQRPATPIFLLSDEQHPIDPQFEASLISHHIKGVYSGSESYSELVKSLNLNPTRVLNDIKRESAARSEYSGFTAIPVIDFLNVKNYPFDVFIETPQKSLNLFAVLNSTVDTEYLLRAAGISRWLYVQDQAIQAVRDQLKEAQLNYTSIKGFPSLWKSAEILFNAKSVLHELQRSGLSDHLVEQTLYMLGDVFQHVSVMALEPANQNLNLFVEQAKNCDKTIASATLSILMCKALKFDRNAVLEILGLASLLQDVSLYNSPYGNLAKTKIQDLSPEAQAFYNQHPLISADLVSQNTSVPDVALQVIRQHHERKDRTGFPNRIGGMQLHPMAEVLSLINAFLDITESSNKVIDSDLYRKLECEVFPHYSDRIVTAFKSVLDSLFEAKSAQQPAA